MVWRWMNHISNGCCNYCSIIILYDPMSKSVVVGSSKFKKTGKGVNFEIVFGLNGLTTGMGRACKRPCKPWWALIWACEQQEVLLWYINITYLKTLNLIHLQNKLQKGGGLILLSFIHLGKKRIVIFSLCAFQQTG